MKQQISSRWFVNMQACNKYSRQQKQGQVIWFKLKAVQEQEK